MNIGSSGEAQLPVGSAEVKVPLPDFAEVFA
jgi:hypothetical protein